VLLALDKMGITAQVKPKIKWVQEAAWCRTRSQGRNRRLRSVPISSDMRNPGLDVVGPCRRGWTPVDITGFLSTSVKDPKGRQALLDYLSSREAAPAYRGREDVSRSADRRLIWRLNPMPDAWQ